MAHVELETFEVAIRFADDTAARELNRTWRGRDYATNVLSFPQVDWSAPPTGPILLGDIVLAHDVCLNEARDKAIPVADHATHLIVHGLLHLLGHDHLDDPGAERMEMLEVRALASLGVADPYGDPDQPAEGLRDHHGG